MSLSSAASDTLEDFGSRQPFFHIGKHDSARHAPLTDAEYGNLLNQGISFVTTPVTNNSFRLKVFQLVSNYLEDLKDKDELATSSATSSRAGPLVWPLTPEDTSLFPSSSVNTYTACISPWIDLCSTDPVIASISRQVLNLEINYASFCGVKSVIIAGPCRDASRDGGNQGLLQYARAIKEALTIGGCLNLLLHMPMYREPIIGHRLETLSVLQQERDAPTDKVIKLFSSWESWHHIRTVCKYNARLCVALKLPRLMPEKDLQNRWFAEPLQYLTISREIFSRNKSGHPCFTTHLQGMLNDYMRLKAAPGLLLCDVGPECRHPEQGPNLMDDGDFPSLAEAHQAATPFQSQAANGANAHMAYLRWLESQQPPMSAFESSTLTGFQDWLQSPLQPLSDNLESATYEVFESDPVKYNQYEATVTKALSEWKELGLPTSKEGAVVVAVAGSGRGPLVTRVLQAAEQTGVPVEVWALEKNPNAYVYLLRQNKSAWGGRVKVIKTDMRAWKGPMVSESVETGPVYGKVDILVSELLGAFGDNELSPECLDGIQHVLARPHGVSIPNSYAAHVSPISTPKIHSELLARSVSDATAFETPWVVRLYALDFVCQRVPHHPRFQQVWEFSHPIPESTLQAIQAKRSGGVIGGGGGSMAGAAGANDHNSRYCHLCFVCRPGGVIHGLAGYFESTLYASRLERSKGDRIEISTHPERIDDKSKDMISWFPIFFPLKNPITFPADSELEVSMWRQTDDTKVWYEWLVEAWTWTGPSSRIKVGSSDLCSSRKVACLM